ncbi:MAG: hypothetical protein ACQKBV_02120, partial [Puniceicoccales bacterium]
ASPPRMSHPATDIFLHACDCRTPLGDARETWARLLDGEIALRPEVPLWDSEERVPLALMGAMDDLATPRWLAPSAELLRGAPDRPWGTARYPVVVTSSNFGIDQMLAAHRTGEEHFQEHATAMRAVNAIAKAQGWGPNRTIISNACVSAQLGLLHAQRLLENDLADEALVFSFDFLSHFVVGGFHALKILNADFPQPYAARESGAIGLGDGLGYAVLSREKSPYRLAAVATHSEFHHMTGNDPSGTGFDAVIAPMREAAQSRPVFIKGHGTGTLEAGQLEAEAAHRTFPEARLASWKGSLGHTLGSCGIVELAITKIAFDENRAPGNVGAAAPYFAPNVEPGPIDLTHCAGAILLSSAFGGAHAAHLLTRD